MATSGNQHLLDLCLTRLIEIVDLSYVIHDLHHERNSSPKRRAYIHEYFDTFETDLLSVWPVLPADDQQYVLWYLDKGLGLYRTGALTFEESLEEYVFPVKRHLNAFKEIRAGTLSFFNDLLAQKVTKKFPLFSVPQYPITE